MYLRFLKLRCQRISTASKRAIRLLAKIKKRIFNHGKTQINTDKHRFIGCYLCLSIFICVLSHGCILTCARSSINASTQRKHESLFPHSLLATRYFQVEITPARSRCSHRWYKAIVRQTVTSYQWLVTSSVDGGTEPTINAFHSRVLTVSSYQWKVSEPL